MNIEVSSKGTLSFEGKEYRCGLGSGGVGVDKKEGDGITPSGCFAVREVFYRPDKLSTPKSFVEVIALQKNDGWCDEPSDPMYNKKVKLPYGASHEDLWRDDEVYDIVITLGYNDDPPVAGRGSAIFIHVARPSYSPTVGCIALAKEDLIEIIGKVSKNTLVCIKG